MLYVASGGSIDWAHGDAGIKFATSMELRDTGTALVLDLIFTLAKT